MVCDSLPRGLFHQSPTRDHHTYTEYESDQEGEPSAGRADGEVAPEAAPWEPSVEMLLAYAGSYYSPELDVIYTLALTEGALTLSIAGADPYELQPREEGTFGFGPATARFARGSQGIDGFVVDAGRVRGIRFERR